VADDPASRRGGPCGCAMQGGRGEWGGGALGFVGCQHPLYMPADRGEGIVGPVGPNGLLGLVPTHGPCRA
jgi:hypothetical protein